MLVVMGMVGLLLRYNIQKYLLLNYFRRPASLDHRLAKLTFTVFPVVIVLHCLLSIWSLGNPEIFPASTSIWFKLLGRQVAELVSSTEAGFLVFIRQLADRATANSPHALVVGLFVAVLLLSLLWGFLSALASALCGKEDTTSTPYNMHYKTMSLKLNNSVLLSFDINENPAYHETVSSVKATLESVL